MITKAVSTWSLHRALGSFVAEDPDLPMGMTTPPDAVPGLDLLALPAELQRRGFTTVQICHFHLAHRDRSYLGEVGSAFAQAGIVMDCLLIDAGDLTHPTEADAHAKWIDRWLSDAETIGTLRARVIAGQQAPTAENLTAAATRLRRLAVEHEVRLVTENWFDLLPDAASVHTLFDQLGDDVGFLIDLGNWTGPTTYDQLTKVAGLAETCHAKAHHSSAADHAAVIDADDYTRTLRILADAGFEGPLALIYDGADPDEWAGLEREHAIVQQVFTP